MGAQMDSNLQKILENNALSDEVKKALIPEMYRERESLRTEGSPKWRKFLSSGPGVAALASVTAAFFSGVFAVSVAVSESKSSQNLELLKFEFEIVRIALNENKSANERLVALTFFQSVGLLSNLNLTDENLNAADLPSIPAQDKTLFSKPRLYAETLETIQLLLAKPTLSVEQKLLKNFWHLYSVELIGVESSDVARSMINFGIELKRVSAAGVAPTAELKRLGKIVIDQMIDEVPEIRVDQN
jgi:hypothetical protein